jgi:predicted nucleic acid-binding Zn ribbon protein
MDRICKNCGEHFKSPPSQIKRGGGIYCSRKCYYESKSTPKICIYCGKTFYLGRKHRNNGINKFCSNECHALFSRQQVEFICEQCGSKFFDTISRDRKFCSRKCHNENKRGKFYSPRIEKTCEICGKIFIINHSNHRFCSKKCSCFWLSYIRNKGKNHPRYKGNLKKRRHYPPKFFEMRLITIRSFNGKCFLCNKNAKTVHHIDYNTENNEIENLILLCESCHGKTNSKREEWKNFFNNEMNKIEHPEFIIKEENKSLEE